MASDDTSKDCNQGFDDDFLGFLALKANDLGISADDPRLFEHCTAAYHCVHCACFAWTAVMLSAESPSLPWLGLSNWVQWLRGLPGLPKPSGDPLDALKVFSPLLELAVERCTSDFDVRRILQKLEVDEIGCLPRGTWDERTAHRAAVSLAEDVLNDLWYPVIGVAGVAKAQKHTVPRFDPARISTRHRGEIRNSLRQYRNIDVIGLMRGINHELACALKGNREQQRTTLLYLAADPSAVNSSAPLRLDKEVRAIETEVRASKNRDELELRSAWAVRAADLSRHMSYYTPSVVHFGCHGNFATIDVEADNEQVHSITHDAVVSLVRVFSNCVRLVVLNVCHSASLARSLAEHVDCAIGMEGPIYDDAAILFAGALYRALASGQSVQTAFDLGTAELALHDHPDINVPKLVSKKGIDPSMVYFTGIRPSSDSRPTRRRTAT